MISIVCIASGASLTKEDVDYALQNASKVFVVSDVYKIAPKADLLYSCDYQWWNYHRPDFAGRKVTLNAKAAEQFNLELVRESDQKWSTVEGFVATGGNSGFQCLNLATTMKPDRVILLGYDMHGGHFFGNHPKEVDRGSNFERWIDRMNVVAPIIPVPVFNCTPNSALECFPKFDLREIL